MVEAKGAGAGALPTDVTVSRVQRFARHRGRCHARRAVRLRVRRERQEPSPAHQALEKRKIHEESCSKHNTLRGATHIESVALHCDE